MCKAVFYALVVVFFSGNVYGTGVPGVPTIGLKHPVRASTPPLTPREQRTAGVPPAKDAHGMEQQPSSAGFLTPGVSPQETPNKLGGTPGGMEHQSTSDSLYPPLTGISPPLTANSTSAKNENKGVVGGSPLKPPLFSDDEDIDDGDGKSGIDVLSFSGRVVVNGNHDDANAISLNNLLAQIKTHSKIDFLDLSNCSLTSFKAARVLAAINKKGGPAVQEVNLMSNEISVAFAKNFIEEARDLKTRTPRTKIYLFNNEINLPENGYVDALKEIKIEVDPPASPVTSDEGEA
ncbi:hypothetical protein OAN22_02535 [Alphaproteobacteria bacterium]|nr:hypothetical protein [Alphaproteobacteria bacterium]